MLTGNKVMHKLHLRGQGITSSTCGPVNNDCEKIKKFKETENLNYI